MRLLLDTHILLWWLSDDPSLPVAARRVIADPQSEIFISAATTWEIAIKHALGRLDAPVHRMMDVIEGAGFVPLSMAVEHTILAGNLPAHHQDPFDRMLIAQAQQEGLTLVSVDRIFSRYQVALIGP